MINKVAEMDLPPILKLVLILCARYADDDGSKVFPGLKRLMKETGLSRRHLLRLLSELQNMGILVEVKKQAPGRNKEYRISFLPEQVPPKAPEQVPPKAPEQVPKMTVTGATQGTRTGAKTDVSEPRIYIDSSLYSSYTHHGDGVCVETEKHFEIFWTVYPPRDGKKAGREKALGLFRQLSAEDQAALIVAARNFAGSDRVARGIGIPDPANFIRRRDRDTGADLEPWRDWIKAAGSGPAKSDNALFEEMDQWHEQTEKERREEKARIAAGEIKPVPRPWDPRVETENQYRRKVAAGAVRMVAVPVKADAGTG